jgi:hypothetical protein
MTYCHVSKQIDEHLHGEMVADRFHEALNKRIAELMQKGAEFYPFTRENIGEALGQLSQSQEIILQTSLEMELDSIGRMVGNWISNYWELQAEKKAIQEFST